MELGIRGDGDYIPRLMKPPCVRKNRPARLVAFAAGVTLAAGCERDVRLADHKVRSVQVGPASHYGLVLDQQASPQQVAFVALRAIRDDVRAAGRVEREAALDVQFSVCAANEIKRRNHSSLDGDEFLFNVVYHWTPTVAHYAGDFPETPEDAQRRFVQRPAKQASSGSNSPEESELAIELADPGGDPAARVVMLAWLAKDRGFWRVVHFGFDQRIRSLNASANRTSQLNSADPGD
ncbi:MAG: hypothetical protein AABZ12_05840 [Planctomycetota bacterium]